MPVTACTSSRAGWRLEVYGTVQGVGFRPFVHRLATELGVDGTVWNAGGFVVIEVAGPRAVLDRLVTRLRTDAPPLARVVAVTCADLPEPPAAGSGFTVAESRAQASGDGGNRGDNWVDIPVDTATCPACTRELFDPADRRYRYPFINCTDCGPRATIIDDLPYDRQRTGMREFALCPACAAEYADPADRRFHAEPLACPRCGPRLSWHPRATADPAPGRAARGAPVARAVGEAALQAAVRVVEDGGIVAVKGLGGYQLVCDATSCPAVGRLRQRKGREAKPFAVMVRDAAAAARLARVSSSELALLCSPSRPIVLLAARDDAVPRLAAGVHPGTRRVGLFLPYSPLHLLLLHDLDRPLVVTSGNLTDEPIVTDDAAAFARLASVADGFLAHDRPILARYDDSVAHVVASRSAVVRRARGWAPASLPLPVPAPVPVLAVGAELKHTFTLAAGTRAIVGPHTGDLEDADTYDAFRATLAHLGRVHAISPEIVAHDRHPAYLSSQFAAGWPPGKRMVVQHHHAHVASCAAEHGLTGPFVGVAYDGLGLGDDGTLWGGEVLVADLAGYRRFARFGQALLPGGAAAVRRPARMALGYLFGAEALGTAPLDDALTRPFLTRLEPREVAVVHRMVDRAVNSPQASSAGRLFDAVASLLGLCDTATYEGEAAVALEAAAVEAAAVEAAALEAAALEAAALEAAALEAAALEAAAAHRQGATAREGAVDAAERRTLGWRLVRRDGLWVYDVVPTLRDVLTGHADGVPVARLAARFHATVAAVTVACCLEAARETGLRDVCLSGGVFQNARLTAAVVEDLEHEGLHVHLNEQVPANDGGISYGQAAVAAARLTGR
jgi:hydrogenase maturation protein HypF